MFKLVNEGLVRTNGETPPKYALEDVLLAKGIKEARAKLIDDGVLKMEKIKGKNKFVIDQHKAGKSQEKHIIDSLGAVFADLTGGKKYMLVEVDEK